MSAQGIKKCRAKVSAIVEAARPGNADEVIRFLGLITYYNKFIPEVATITYPLRRLLEKNAQFKWDEECEKAFTQLKKEIISERVLVASEAGLSKIPFFLFLRF